MQEAERQREPEVTGSQRDEVLHPLLSRVVPALLAVAALFWIAPPGLAILAAIALAGWILWEREARQRRERQRLEAEADDWRNRASRLSSALMTMPDAVVIVDEAGSPQVFNPAAEHLLGVGPTDQPPSEWAAVYGTFRADGITPYPSQDLPLVRALHGRATDESNMLIRNERQEGVWMSASARPLRDENGTPRGAVLVCHDVTERRRREEEIRNLNSELEERVRERTASLREVNERLAAESEERAQVAAALRQSQQLLEQFIGHSTSFIFVKDLEGRYMLVSRNWDTLVPIGWQNMKGRRDEDVFPLETVAALRANDRLVAEEKVSLQFEEVVPRGDGEPRTYLSEKFPLFDAEGRVYAVCGVATDITERKRMEADLRRSEASLSAMIESTSDSVWSIDRKFRLLTMNTALKTAYQEIFGAPVEGDRGLEGRAPGAFLRVFADLYRRVFAGERVSVEQRFDTGGVTRHYLISMCPIREGDEITGATGFSRDITELRHTEEMARRNQAELTHVLRLGTMGEIASALAHEINQPLGAIANYASACVRSLDVGASPALDLRQGLELIAAEALRAGAIIRRLRDLGRKGEGTPQALDVNLVVHRAAELVRPEIQLQGIALSIDTAADLPPIYADGIQIEQVLLNLLLNGIESMQESRVKVLSVATARSDGHVEVSVRDTGMGLDPGVGDQVFEPFFTTKSKGLGMGLAISRRIIEAHGGHLSGEPNLEGTGSLFRVVLPVAL